MSLVFPPLTWHVRWPCLETIGALVRFFGIATLVNNYGKETYVLKARYLYFFSLSGRNLKNIFLLDWHVRCFRVKNILRRLKDTIKALPLLRSLSGRKSLLIHNWHVRLLRVKKLLYYIKIIIQAHYFFSFWAC